MLADFHSMFSVLFGTSATCSSMQYRVATDEKQRGRVFIVCGLYLCSPHHPWLVPLQSPSPVTCASAVPIICDLCLCSLHHPWLVPLQCVHVYLDFQWLNRCDYRTSKGLVKKTLSTHPSLCPLLPNVTTIQHFKKSCLNFPFIHLTLNFNYITKA